MWIEGQDGLDIEDAALNDELDDVGVRHFALFSLSLSLFLSLSLTLDKSLGFISLKDHEHLSTSSVIVCRVCCSEIEFQAAVMFIGLCFADQARLCLIGGDCLKMFWRFQQCASEFIFFV